MNEYFGDSRYYLARVDRDAGSGTARPNQEPEPKPTRLEAVREELLNLERTAETQAREAAGSARAALSRPGADESADGR